MLTLITEMAGEVRLALRGLRRRPGFTAVAVATLALAIGGPAAIFSVVHAVLIRPLPYPQPDRLVTFRMEGRGQGGHVAFDALPVSSALEWAGRGGALESIAVYNDRALTLSAADGPFRLTGATGTPNLFDILGVAPTLGRAFDPSSRDPRRVVLSHDTWQRFFGANPSIVDSTVVFDGERYLVTGVMPEGFGFPSPETAFWVPFFLDPGGTRGMVLPAVGRLRPGATLAEVHAEGSRLLEDMNSGPMRHTLTVTTMQEQMVGGVRRILWVLMAAVGAVFLIGTVNIALLLLTRGTARQREFSIRLALGAASGRLARQLALEGLTLATLGGAAGVALAAVALQILVRLAPADMPRLREAALDGPVLLFTLALVLLTTVIFGALSAGRLLVVDAVRALGRPGAESIAPGGRAPRRQLNALAAGELALTVVLLVAAGLLLRSFTRLLLVDQGFRHRGALAFQINLPSSRYPTSAARVAFHERLLERLRQAPGIEAAGMITAMPNRQPSARFVFSSVPIVGFDPMSTPVHAVRTASEGFFDAMGIPLIAGRGFAADDRRGGEKVIVLSERLARQQFPDRDPIGQTVYSMRDSWRVVGVVGDVRPAVQEGLVTGAAYLPFRQDDEVFRWFGTVSIVVRGRDLTSAAAAVRSLVLSLDPQMPPFNVRTLSQEVGRLVAAPRFSATAVGLFAAVALMLAAVGVYGVMAFSAGQRTREIGIRVALGSTRARVLRLMMRDGLLVVSIGLVAGLLAAGWLSRGLTGLLHEVTPADPIALGAVALALSSAGLLAAFVPAWKATRINAIDALRDE